MFRFSLPFLLAAVAATSAGAAPILLSVSGQFSNSDVAVSPLVVPNGTFSLSFVFDSDPLPSNVTSGGFDVPFWAFGYELNNVAVNVAPSFIRFWSAGSGGLFSVFFGPESGFINGIPIPIFEFTGPQLFTGTTSVPQFDLGTLQTTSWTYSDVQNFDSQATSLTVAVTPTPEPSSLLLGGAGLGAALIGAMRRSAKQTSTAS